MRILNDSPCPVVPLMVRLRPGAYSMAVIVKATLALVPGDDARMAEEQRLPHGDLFRDDDRSRELVYPSDFVPFKPRADIMLVGSCRTPGGEPMTACRAALAVGPLRRVFAVIGRRYWRRRLGFSRMEEPEPFTEMPLTWENAFGGKDHRGNPVGRGIAANGAPLPTLEDPAALIDGPSAGPEPAAPGPVNPDWRPRRRKAGRYGGRWLEERWPAFPEDFDWSYFNAAPASQQLDGYLRGDEVVELEHLHPTMPLLRSRLPGRRARCFLADQAGDRRGGLTEIPLRLDTLWIDADLGEAVAVWRGLTEVGSERFSDLGDLVLSWELLADEPRDAAAVEALREQLWRIELEEDEAPEEQPPTPEPAAPQPDEARTRLREELGIELDRREAAADAEPAPDREEVRRQMAAVGVPQAEMETVLAQLDGPATDAGPGAEARVRSAHANGRALEDEDLSGLRLPGEPLSGIALRGCLMAGAALGGAGLARSDLRASVLAGAGLQDTDLEDSLLDGVDLTGADLRGCSLRRARLEGAVLADADLRGADLTGATGSAVDLSGGDLRGACLEGAWLTACDLVGTRLEGARLAAGVFTDSDFGAAAGEAADFRGCDLTGARFGEGARLPRAVLAGVQAPGSQWEGADLRGVDLRAAQLTRADFTDADLGGALLALSRMRGACLERCRLAGADLRQVDLSQATLELADLTGTDLRGASLYEAETLDATLEGTRLNGAILANTKLEP